MCTLINTAKNDLISALELYYYKFIDSFSNLNLKRAIGINPSVNNFSNKFILLF